MPPAAQDELELLRGALDASPVAFFVLDPVGRYRALAGGGFALTGTGPPERYLGRSMPEGEGVPAALRQLLVAALAGEKGHLVAPMHGREWAFNIVPLVDRDGAPAGCAGLAIDVTHERREAALRRESEARLAALVEALPFDVWSRDAAGRPSLQNAASRRVHGELGEPSDGHHRAMRGELVRHEVVRALPDGERTFLEVVAPVEEGGRLIGTVGANIDVSPLARQRAQSEFLAEAAHALAACIEYEETLKVVARLAVPVLADACVVDVVEDGEVRRVGVAVADPAKQPLAEALCKHTPPLDAPFGLAVVLRSGEPLLVPELPEIVLTGGEEERQQLGVDGAEHQKLLVALGTRSLMSVPLVARSRALGAITFHATRAGRYGEDDLAFARDLASRAALAVDNARLYREAREAIAAREEFLSIASHELRSPLTALNLSVQALGRPAMWTSAETPAPQRRALDSIERQSRRLARLVETLLDVTRAQAGQLELAIERTDLSTLAEEVARQFEDEARAAGVAIQVVKDGPSDGDWDRGRLEQVVTNLVSNAVKYGAKSPVTLRVVGQPDGVVLRVEDRGPGIAADQQARLFQRFARVPTGQRITGLGLGLFIVKKIVDAHGGQVRIESAPGAGTAFVVQLPRVAPPRRD